MKPTLAALVTAVSGIGAYYLFFDRIAIAALCILVCGAAQLALAYYTQWHLFDYTGALTVYGSILLLISTTHPM